MQQLLNTLTIQQEKGSRQRTNANEYGIKIWKITDMEVKARIQIWKNRSKDSNLEN
jgi:hypothetical protein